MFIFLILLAMPFPPQHVLQWLRRECFGLEQPWARSNLYEITSILNVLIHQNAFKAGPKPINSTELETYRCQHTWIQLPTSEVKAFCVWLYLCSYTAHILNCLPNIQLPSLTPLLNTEAIFGQSRAKMMPTKLSCCDKWPALRIGRCTTTGWGNRAALKNK